MKIVLTEEEILKVLNDYIQVRMDDSYLKGKLVPHYDCGDFTCIEFQVELKD